MDFSSKVQTPLSYKRKRVDNCDIEEQRIANYDATWRQLDGYLTKLSIILDSYIPALSLLRQSIDNMKAVLVIKAGKSHNAIKEKESKQISSNRKMAGIGSQEEQQRHDKYVYHQSGRSSYNVATNYEALKTEIDNFLGRVATFINEAIDRLHSTFAREEKFRQELASIVKMLEKTRARN